jgi:hypothetical protein
LFSVPLQIEAIGALRIGAVRVVAGAFHAAKAESLGSEDPSYI